jgi:hypothetical protein
MKGKTRTRQARGDVLKANTRARQRAQARDMTRAKAKPYDRQAYDGHSSEEVNDGP